MRISVIIQLVSDYFETTPALLKSPSRSRNLVHARWAVIYLLRQHTEGSLAQIGNCIGRSHTTVIYARQQLFAKMQKDEAFAKVLSELERRLQNEPT